MTSKMFEADAIFNTSMQHQKMTGMNVDTVVTHINAEFIWNVFKIRESLSARCSDVMSWLPHVLLMLSVEGTRTMSR